MPLDSYAIECSKTKTGSVTWPLSEMQERTRVIVRRMGGNPAPGPPCTDGSGLEDDSEQEIGYFSIFCCKCLPSTEKAQTLVAEVFNDVSWWKLHHHVCTNQEQKACPPWQLVTEGTNP